MVLVITCKSCKTSFAPKNRGFRGRNPLYCDRCRLARKQAYDVIRHRAMKHLEQKIKLHTIKCELEGQKCQVIPNKKRLMNQVLL